MPELRATISVCGLKPGDVRLTRQQGRDTMWLQIGGQVDVTLADDLFAAEPGVEAAAMRRLAVLATEAAEVLERRAAAAEGGGDAPV